MIILKLHTDWGKVKRLLKRKYPALTEEELAFHPGGENILVEKISSKLKLPQEDIRTAIFKMKSLAELNSAELADY